MMKRAMFACVLLVVGVPSAIAETTFSGVLQITDETPQCQNSRKGRIWPARFHPTFAGQDDNSEGITINFDFGAAGYRMESGKFPSAAGIFKAGHPEA